MGWRFRLNKREQLKVDPFRRWKGSREGKESKVIKGSRGKTAQHLPRIILLSEYAIANEHHHFYVLITLERGNGSKALFHCIESLLKLFRVPVRGLRW